MIRLIQKKLIIPRGDTGTFSVPVLTSFTEGDKAIFSIIDIKTNKIILPIECKQDNGILTIEFTHEDTVNLPIGKFSWDIKIYQEAQIIEGVIIGGKEVDSYYAAYRLPICEIRQTGDKLLTSDDSPSSTLNNENFNLLNATLNEVRETNNTLQQYKGELQTMLHQEERIQSLENTVEVLTNNFNSISADISEMSTQIEGAAKATDTVLNTTLTHGRRENSVIGENSFAFGKLVTASGKVSHAEGNETIASGNYSHAEGSGSVASGFGSHAEGSSEAQAQNSHAENLSNAYGVSSHSQNSGRAYGEDCHAQGYFTQARGNYSHAEGYYTLAKGKSQHVFGEYNISEDINDSSVKGEYIEIVGNGTSNNRSNARTLDWQGNEQLAGSLTLGKGTADEITITAAQLKQLLALLS